MGHRVAQGLLWVVLAVAALVYFPRSALACTILLEQKLVGVPSDGATDVPTDVQPTISRYELDPTGLAEVEFTLTSESGEEVAFQLESPYVWDAVIVPDQLLSADTQYTLSVVVSTDEGTTSLSSQFRTGEGMLATKPMPPRTELQPYEITRNVDPSCGPPESGTCVPLAAGEVVEVRYVDGVSQYDKPYLYRGGFYIDLSSEKEGTNFACIELKTRAINGAVSEPTVLCGPDFPIQHFSGVGPLTCTDSGLETSLTPEPKSSGGCSVSQKNPAGLSAILLALALVARVYTRIGQRQLGRAACQRS